MTDNQLPTTFTRTFVIEPSAVDAVIDSPHQDGLPRRLSDAANHDGYSLGATNIVARTVCVGRDTTVKLTAPVVGPHDNRAGD